MEKTNSTIAKSKDELFAEWDETLRQYNIDRKIMETCVDEHYEKAKEDFETTERKLMRIKKQIEELMKCK